jgi:hypothetical protein
LAVFIYLFIYLLIYLFYLFIYLFIDLLIDWFIYLVVCVLYLSIFIQRIILVWALSAPHSHSQHWLCYLGNTRDTTAQCWYWSVISVFCLCVCVCFLFGTVFLCSDHLVHVWVSVLWVCGLQWIII